MIASVATTETLVSQRSAACSPYDTCLPGCFFFLNTNCTNYTNARITTLACACRMEETFVITIVRFIRGIREIRGQK